jgi:hypothetical protein
MEGSGGVWSTESGGRVFVVTCFIDLASVTLEFLIAICNDNAAVNCITIL